MCCPVVVIDWLRWCDTEFEPLVDRAVQLGLAAGEQVAHPLDADRGFRLQPRQLGHLRVGRLPRRAGARPAPRSRRAASTASAASTIAAATAA